MARLTALLPFQFRAYWRDLKNRGVLAGANFTVLLIFCIWLLPGFIGQASVAAMRMKADPGGTGALFTEILLTSALLVWLVLPLLTSGVQAGQGTMPALRLAHLPLSHRELFGAAVGGALVQPLYWLLIIVSILTFVPLLAAPRAPVMLLAGLLFTVFTAGFSWALSLVMSALFASRRVRELTVFALLLFVVGGFMLLPSDFSMEGGALSASRFGKEILLLSADGNHGALAGLRSWTPGAWVVNAGGPGSALPWLALLAAAAALTVFAAVRSFRRLLTEPVVTGGGKSGRARAIGGVPFLDARLGAPVAKELRYLLRTMDSIFGILLGVGVAVFLLGRADPPLLVPVLAIPGILVMVAAVPMGAFGLDRAGVDRYRLMPLSGSEILFTKNLAFLIVYGLQILPVLIGTAVRFGAWITFAITFGALTYAMLVLFVGNPTSIRSPAPRAFYNFDSKEQTGGILPVLYMMLVSAVPMAVGALAYLSLPGMALAQLLLMGAVAIAYRGSLGAMGRLFDESAHVMRDRLGR